MRPIALARELRELVDALPPASVRAKATIRPGYGIALTRPLDGMYRLTLAMKPKRPPLAEVRMWLSAFMVPVRCKPQYDQSGEWQRAHMEWIDQTWIDQRSLFDEREQRP